MSPFKRRLLKEQLGQVLIQRGVITPDQLKKALEVQKERGKLLGEVLTELGMATEEDIVQALAIQHDFPYLPLANYEIDPEVTKLIPQEVARKYNILPVDKMGDLLTLVMGNPLEIDVIEEIEALTKCKIEIFVSTYTEIKEAIQRFYAQKEDKKAEGKTEDGQES